VVIVVIDPSQSAGHDDDEEHQGADAESPAGTVVPHDGELDAVYVEALIPIPPLTAYHRRQPVRHVLDSADARGPFTAGTFPLPDALP
jgi:hypothetical protein